MEDINEQYLNEFLEALQTSINQMAADGIRISYVPSKGMELGKYMSNVLDDQWKELRGMEIQSVGIASISYDETSQELINMRNKGAMMGDPSIREGYVQSTIAEGLKGAGTNTNGAMSGFMGMGLGMQNGGAFMGAASAANMQQMQMNRQMQQGQQMGYGAGNGSVPGGQMGYGAGNGGVPGGQMGYSTGNNGAQAVQPAQSVKQTWICTACHVENTGKFCSECGKPKPSAEWTCPVCGTVNKGKFCSECGNPRGEA